MNDGRELVEALDKEIGIDATSTRIAQLRDSEHQQGTDRMSLDKLIDNQVSALVQAEQGCYGYRWGRRGLPAIPIRHRFIWENLKQDDEKWREVYFISDGQAVRRPFEPIALTSIPAGEEAYEHVSTVGRHSCVSLLGGLVLPKPTVLNGTVYNLGWSVGLADVGMENPWLVGKHKAALIYQTAQTLEGDNSTEKLVWRIGPARHADQDNKVGDANVIRQFPSTGELPYEDVDEESKYVILGLLKEAVKGLKPPHQPKRRKLFFGKT